MSQMPHLRRWLFVLLCSFAVQGCSDDSTPIPTVEPSVPTEPGASVSWGTSFGECQGYCRTELMLKEGSGEYIESGWTDEVQPESQSFGMEPGQWSALWTEIDIEVLGRMDPVYGCPDCADGGAEWIQVIDGEGFGTRIEFEYGHAPSEIESLVNVVRGFVPGRSGQR